MNSLSGEFCQDLGKDFDQIWGQIFGQVLGQVFVGPENTVCSSSGSETSKKLLEKHANIKQFQKT